MKIKVGETTSSMAGLILTGEYQPVYDELAAILLLVLALFHRYGLNSHDVGLAPDGSFVARLLRNGAASQPVETLSEEQDKHLSIWVRGLYGTENISDELLSSCLPQNFYLIVPTLFDQSIHSCQANVLPMETLKGGLECRQSPSPGATSTDSLSPT